MSSCSKGRDISYVFQLLFRRELLADIVALANLNQLETIFYHYLKKNR